MSAVGVIGDVLQGLAEHADIVEIAMDAVKRGVSKDTIKDSIKALIREASDAEMKREFPDGQSQR